MTILCYFFTVRWCSFALKYIHFGKWIIYNSRVILSLLLGSFKINFGFAGYVSTSCYWPFFTRWEEDIGGLSRDNITIFCWSLLYFDKGVIGRQDFFFRARFASSHTHPSLLIFFVCFFILYSLHHGLSMHFILILVFGLCFGYITTLLLLLINCTYSAE